MFKMENLKGTIIGSCFLFLVLFTKGLYSGEHTSLLSFILVIVFVIGPILLMETWKHHKQKTM